MATRKGRGLQVEDLAIRRGVDPRLTADLPALRVKALEEQAVRILLALLRASASPKEHEAAVPQPHGLRGQGLRV